MNVLSNSFLQHLQTDKARSVKVFPTFDDKPQNFSNFCRLQYVSLGISILLSAYNVYICCDIPYKKKYWRGTKFGDLAN